MGQRCIEGIIEKPFIINPLTVTVQSSGKKRLILDLRHVNKFIYKQKFKCEDVKTAMQLLDKDFFMFKFDLKSAYHHIEIFEEHRRYLAFAWNFGQSKARYFRFCVLAFGLSTAPFVFTKLLKALIRYWRSQGIPIVVFLDDSLGGGATQRQAKIHSLTVHSDLLKCGFLINEDKSQWTPLQETIWLGYVINTLTNYIRATNKRVQKLLSAIEELIQGHLTRGKVHVKNLASVVGQIISFELTARTTIRLMTRFSYKVVQSAASWNSCIQLDESSLQELNFWQQNITSLNKQQIRRNNKIPSQIVYSDASNSACGAISQIDGIKKTFHRNWSESKQQQSSSRRELRAVCYAVEAFKPDLQSRTVCWFTDNQSIVSIISA